MMNIDHVVLWVVDPLSSLRFYRDMLGMTAVREEEYEAGKAPFPSVRVNDDCIIDLMATSMLDPARKMTGGQAGGQALNHLCINLERVNYEDIERRLARAGVEMTPGPKSSFGAQGYTPHSFYFNDPDNNIIELRYYQ